MPDVTDRMARREERVDAGTLRVTRRSTFSGAVHTMEMPISAEEWLRYTSQPHKLIQEVLPHLSNEQREFLLTGTTQEEWAKAFPPEEDDMFDDPQFKADVLAERSESGL